LVFTVGSAVVELRAHGEQPFACDSVRSAGTASDQPTFAKALEHGKAAIGEAQALPIEAVDLGNLAGSIACEADQPALREDVQHTLLVS
jgi:hypothetical protein